MSLPTIIDEGDRSPRYSGTLPKLQAEINGSAAIGMMDTINEGKKIRMQGVNLTGDQSIGLCEHVDVPFAGVTTKAHFHVFKKAPYPFILGQPWIQDHLIAVTETGHVNKILIRDFKDPKNRVTMILRNEASPSPRGDLPTVVEMGTPVETAAYYGIDEERSIPPETLHRRSHWSAHAIVFWPAAFSGTASWANARILKWTKDEVLPLVAESGDSPVIHSKDTRRHRSIRHPLKTEKG